jgi:hypothetical protein
MRQNSLFLHSYFDFATLAVIKKKKEEEEKERKKRA